MTLDPPLPLKRGNFRIFPNHGGLEHRKLDNSFRAQNLLSKLKVGLSFVRLIKIFLIFRVLETAITEGLHRVLICYRFTLPLDQKFDGFCFLGTLKNNEE